MLWIRFDSQAAVFAAGNRYPCTRESAEALCDTRQLAAVTAEFAEPTVVCALLNDGHLYLEREG
jgi:hypothetical protein